MLYLYRPVHVVNYPKAVKPFYMKTGTELCGENGTRDIVSLLPTVYIYIHFCPLSTCNPPSKSRCQNFSQLFIQAIQTVLFHPFPPSNSFSSPCIARLSAQTFSSLELENSLEAVCERSGLTYWKAVLSHMASTLLSISGTWTFAALALFLMVALDLALNAISSL